MVRRLMAGLVPAVLLAVVVACGSGGADPATPVDARAYSADSGELSFDEGLRRAGISVPACLAPDLRYALVNDGFNYYYIVYLGLHTSEECMNEFLDANNIAHDITGAQEVESVSREKPLDYHPLWMDNKVVKQLGWALSEDQPFLPYGGRTHTGYTVDMVIQHVAGSTDVLGYLYAFHGG